MKLTIIYLALVASVPASAQSTPWFVQGSAGRVSTDLTVSGAGVKADSNAASRSLGVGYFVIPSLAVTAGFRDLGSMRVYRDSGTSQFSASMKGSAYTLGLAAKLPLADKISAEVSGGAYRWTNKIDAPQGSGSAAAHGTKAYFGAGAWYAMTTQTEVGINWTRLKSPQQNASDSDVFEVALRYRF